MRATRSRLDWRAALALLLVAVALPARAQVVASAGQDCHEAARIAESRFGIPAGLLDSIGHVESGRGAAGTPWPWTVNADGHGAFFDSREEAAAWVARLRDRGTRLIDVGCFQVDLYWHPDAFSSTEAALDPATNAQEAARFLVDLHRQTADWPTAVARYHSASLLLGATYRDRVLEGKTAVPAAGDVAAIDPYVIVLSNMGPRSPGLLPHVVRAALR